MIERLRRWLVLVFGVGLFALLVIYNRTRVYWRPGRRFGWVPDHIPVVDAIVSASEFVAIAIALVAFAGLAFQRVQGIIRE